MENKKFWKSRIVWVNFIALLAVIAQMQWGIVVSPDLAGF